MKNILILISFLFVFSIYGQKVNEIIDIPTVKLILKNNNIESNIGNNKNKTNLTYQFSHPSFLIVSRDWITNRFTSELNLFKMRNNVHYDEKTTSCESFSFISRFVSQTLESINPAVGVIFYIKDNKQAHAINFCIVDDNIKYSIVFYEPQTGQIMELSKKEIKSIYFWYL